MHNPSYRIPDIVRIEAVKPDGLTITEIGQYTTDNNSPGAEYTHEISKEQMDMEGVTFVPSGGNGDDSQNPQDGIGQTVNTEPVPTPDVPGIHSKVAADVSQLAQHAFDRIHAQGGVTLDLNGQEPKQGYAYSPYPELAKPVPADTFSPNDIAQYIQNNQQALSQPGNHLGGWMHQGNVILDVAQVGPPTPETVQKAAQAQQKAVFDLASGQEIMTGYEGNEGITASLRDDICPQCDYRHITSAMTTPTIKLNECYRCAHQWTTQEEDFSVEGNTVTRDWLNEDSSPIEFSERAFAMATAGVSRNLGDIAQRDPRLLAIRERLNEAAQERTAGKKYSPREQREFIDEEGVARNADRLQLEDTHYAFKPDHLVGARPDRVDDNYLGLGL